MYYMTKDTTEIEREREEKKIPPPFCYSALHTKNISGEGKVG